MRRAFVLTMVLATLTLGVGPVTGAAEADSDAPVLWRGQVVDEAGRPATATVHAALRLPASALPADAADPALVTAVPLARAETATDGTFELRSFLPELPPAFQASGWAHLVVSALASDGSWSLAVDSVRYVQGPGGRGLWASTAGGAELASRYFDGEYREGWHPKAPLAVEAAGPDQRPGRLVLNPLQSEAALPLKQSVGPGEPYEACTPVFTEGAPRKAFRTVADIDVDQDWSFKMTYRETDSTAWEVGYEKGQSGKWAVAGSVSFNDRGGKGYDTEFGPYAGRYRESFQVELEHVKVVWRCGDHRSPGPFYVRTVEPRDWTGGTYNQGEPAVRCNPKFVLPVAGHTFSYRDNGSSSKYSASGNVFGFNGRASVEYSQATVLGWKNHQEQPRHVCGESAKPLDGRTRVAAMPA